MKTQTTRREFVKRSVLAGASAAAATMAAAKVAGDKVAADLRAADGTPGEPSRARRSRATPVAGHPYPLVPYGSGQPIYLADLDRCEPSSALAKTWEPNRWKLHPFAAEGVEGVMVAAGQNTGVPDLEYPLTQKGWHAIYFGIFSESWESHLQVRFKGDRASSILTPNDMSAQGLTWDQIQWSKHSYKAPGVEELFWRYADLGASNASLVLGQVKVQLLPGDENAFGNVFHSCWLAYIKLVPLTEAEVAKLQEDRGRRDTRRLFAADDAFTPSGCLHFRTEEDIRRQIEPYRDTDFSRMYWEAGMGDLSYYPSKVGRLVTFDWAKEHYRNCDRLVSQTYGDFQRRGIDPFRVALEYSHEIGLEFHASYRVAGFKFPPPGDEWNAGGMWEKHPEWRSLDRQGRATPRLSYAFAGVRDHVYAVQEEIVRNYPVEGICLLYNRRLPVLGYEAPLVDTFKAQFGMDPFKLAEDDPRWLAHSAGVLTGFMRELRRRMRAEQATQGRKPIGITAIVMGSRKENYGYGLDLDAWVKEGLIDTLIPYTSVQGGDSRGVAWADPEDARYFIDLTRGTGCRLALDIMPREIAPEDYKRRVDALYRAGAENFFFWDCYQRMNFDPCWTTLTRLGHKDELADWRSRGSPAVERPRRALSKIGDWDLSYVTPG